MSDTFEKVLNDMCDDLIVHGTSSVLMLDPREFQRLQDKLAEVTKALEDQGVLLKSLGEINIELVKERDQWKASSFQEYDKRKALEDWQTKAIDMFNKLDVDWDEQPSEIRAFLEGDK